MTGVSASSSPYLPARSQRLNIGSQRAGSLVEQLAPEHTVKARDAPISLSREVSRQAPYSRRFLLRVSGRGRDKIMSSRSARESEREREGERERERERGRRRRRSRRRRTRKKKKKEEGQSVRGKTKLALSPRWTSSAVASNDRSWGLQRPRRSGTNLKRAVSQTLKRGAAGMPLAWDEPAMGIRSVRIQGCRCRH